MKIIVNGEALKTAARTLDDLCRAMDLGDAKIATALNGDFVPAARRRSAKLSADDRVEIVSPRQGG